MTLTLATLASADGLHSIEFSRNANGHVRFTEMVRRREEAEWADGGLYEYWGFGLYSGLYASLDEAQIDAKRELPWYRAETASED